MNPGLENIHKTVLLQEVIHWLQPRPDGFYVDGTTGLGGHSQAILEKAKGKANLLCLDRDAQSLALAQKRLKKWADNIQFMHLAFSNIENALEEIGWKGVDGVVLDLGVSSMQLDSPQRGFSFMESGPLDMRMDTASGLAPASSLVNKGSFSELKRIIAMYGEEPLAGRIVKAIIREREQGEIVDTAHLAKIVSEAYPAKWRAKARTHPATRTFQALRIAVNNELKELELFLDCIAECLKPSGKVAIISFHSLEDRLVKRAFRALAEGCICPKYQALCTCGQVAKVQILTKKPQIPTEEEMGSNPRSRSAKLRVAQKLSKEALS